MIFEKYLKSVYVVKNHFKTYVVVANTHVCRTIFEYVFEILVLCCLWQNVHANYFHMPSTVHVQRVRTLVVTEVLATTTIMFGFFLFFIFIVYFISNVKTTTFQPLCVLYSIIIKKKKTINTQLVTSAFPIRVAGVVMVLDKLFFMQTQLYIYGKMFNGNPMCVYFKSFLRVNAE